MTSKRTGLMIIIAATLGVVVGIGLDRVVTAEQPALVASSGVKRTMLQTVDVPGSTTHQVVMAVAEIAPGTNAGPHRHPGIEIGYLLEGTVEMSHEGKPMASAKTGDSFKNELQAVHDVKNVGKTPARVLAVYIVEKGKPLAEPVK